MSIKTGQVGSLHCRDWEQHGRGAINSPPRGDMSGPARARQLAQSHYFESRDHVGGPLCFPPAELRVAQIQLLKEIDRYITCRFKEPRGLRSESMGRKSNPPIPSLNSARHQTCSLTRGFVLMSAHKRTKHVCDTLGRPSHSDGINRTSVSEVFYKAVREYNHSHCKCKNTLYICVFNTLRIRLEFCSLSIASLLF